MEALGMSQDITTNAGGVSNSNILISPRNVSASSMMSSISAGFRYWRPLRAIKAIWVPKTSTATSGAATFGFDPDVKSAVRTSSSLLMTGLKYVASVVNWKPINLIAKVADLVRSSDYWLDRHENAGDTENECYAGQFQWYVSTPSNVSQSVGTIYFDLVIECKDPSYDNLSFLSSVLTSYEVRVLDKILPLLPDVLRKEGQLNETEIAELCQYGLARLRFPYRDVSSISTLDPFERKLLMLRPDPRKPVMPNTGDNWYDVPSSDEDDSKEPTSSLKEETPRPQAVVKSQSRGKLG